MKPKIRLEQTSWDNPEQYDAFVGDRRVGYLRLRYGVFTVTCPDVGGERVLEAEPAGYGTFLREERDEYLDRAKSAISGWLSREEVSP